MHTPGQNAGCALLAGLVLLGAGSLVCDATDAATASPGWTISSVAEPSDFSSADSGECEAAPGGVPPNSSPCDSYRVVVRNVGSRPSSEPITITDSTDAGVSPVFASLEQHQPGVTISKTTCTLAPVSCHYSGPVAPGGELIVTINVTVAPGAGPRVLNSARVEGGNLASLLATSEPTTQSNAVNGATPTFAVEGFDLRTNGLDGQPDLQAGDHPFGLTASLHVPSVTRFVPSGGGAPYQRVPLERIKDLIAELPTTLVANPQATARCPLTALKENFLGKSSPTNCPAASRIGTATIESQGIFHTSNAESETSSIFNMFPEAGYPAEFGLSYLGNPVIMYVSVLPTPSGYGIALSVGGLVDLPIQGVSLTFFGEPAQQDGFPGSSGAFLSNPTTCALGGLQAKLEADSWEEPGRWVSAESTTFPQVLDCDLLQFDPTVAVTPTETTQADTPSGYEVDLRVPLAANFSPELATPDLKSAEISLPEGLSLSPGGASGLTGCAEAGPEGINMTHGWTPTGAEPLDPADPEAIEIGSDGLPRVAAGHCPDASQIGTVEVTTPLLSAPLAGHVYVAQPKCGGEGQPACTPASAANGELFGLYLEAAGSGVTVKLAASLSVDPASGKITARFQEGPQLPFSELKLNLKSGPRSTLANSPTCGEARTTSSVEPWSAPESGAPATPSSSFAVTGCAAPTPFGPAFSAGSLSPLAGSFSPFTLTISRSDGQQYLSGLSVHTPPGLLAALSSVAPCPEPQAAQGTCGPESAIGHTQVAAGSGSQPYWEPGAVFLTGPYENAPFGLSIVTHVQAGPFDLGNMIVRAAISVNPHSAALSFKSDPLPQIVDGVPLRIQTVSLTLDRPGFILNPSSCAPLSIAGTLSGAGGGSEPVSYPFQVGNCARLPFGPQLTATATGKASKADGAGMSVRLTSPGLGQASIQQLALSLPKALPLRLSTLQKACTEGVFDANPGRCPAGSDVGSATVRTPLLTNALSGPIYLVSRGGVALPEVRLVLQGEGIMLILDGQAQIAKGIAAVRFQAVPDVPFTTFEADLSSGPNSALTSNVPAKSRFSLCGTKFEMPTELTAQDGAVLRSTTNVALSGCGAVKASKASHLTPRQKLVRALKACAKQTKRKRPACRRHARKRFAPHTRPPSRK